MQPCWFAFPKEDRKKLAHDAIQTWATHADHVPKVRQYKKKRKKEKKRETETNWLFNLWDKQSTFIGGGGGDKKCLVIEVIFLQNAQHHW